MERRLWGRGKYYFQFTKLRRHYEWTLIFHSGHVNATSFIKEKQCRLYGIIGAGILCFVGMFGNFIWTHVFIYALRCLFKAWTDFFAIVQIGTNQWWRNIAWNRGQSKSGCSVTQVVPYATVMCLSKWAENQEILASLLYLLKSSVETSVRRPWNQPRKIFYQTCCFCRNFTET